VHQAACVACVAAYQLEYVATIRRDVVGRLGLRQIVEEIPAHLGFTELKIRSNAVAGGAGKSAGSWACQSIIEKTREVLIGIGRLQPLFELMNPQVVKIGGHKHFFHLNT
jgi:hypothetical protein